MEGIYFIFDFIYNFERNIAQSTDNILNDTCT